MTSIKLPNMFNNTTTNIVSDLDATRQNLTMLLLSEKGSLFGDPYFGTKIKEYFFSQNDYVLQDILVDDIYTAIAEFIPQLKVNRSDITFEKSLGSLTVKIIGINQKTFQTDMYNIMLFKVNT